MKKRDLIKKAFIKYADEDVIGQILNGSQELRPLETKQIDFAMVLVDDRDPHECASIIYKSIRIIRDCYDKNRKIRPKKIMPEKRTANFQ